MTLQHFLDVTANVPDMALRQAMVAALAVEPARTPEARRRFYDRVARELNLDALDDPSSCGERHGIEARSVCLKCA